MSDTEVVAGEQKIRTPATAEAKQGERTGQPKYIVRNFKETIHRIKEADDTLVDSITEWESTDIIRFNLFSEVSLFIDIDF